ncbi:transposase, partial [Gilvimarinus sp. SDUM040013]
WRKLFKGPLVVQRHLAKQVLAPEELILLSDIVKQWRHRLADISWFMRCLNEPIARMANKEDKCTGRFFEGRFKSQALLDERALLSCMAYVDLNPIRASMAKTPETSDYTSIQERLGINPANTSKPIESHQDTSKSPLSLAELMPFAGRESHNTSADHIPFHLSDYLELVDWTGRAIRNDKRGAINNSLPSILERLNIPSTDWLESCCHIESQFS